MQRSICLFLSKIAEQGGFDASGTNSVDAAATVLQRREFDCVSLEPSTSGLHPGSPLLAELNYRTTVLTSYDELCAEAHRVELSLNPEFYS